MEMAQYPLDSSDILASIYRSQRTEVIAGWDERFNREIYEAYHHEQLLRIFIPIMLGDRVLGVAEIGYDREEKRFVREEELQFLNAFMDQAAIALENARLFERAQRRVTQERLVGEITERMQQAPDMQSLLRVTADALTEVLGGSRAYARMTSPAPEVQEQVDEGVVD
jgi:GAF domain-containing protein